MTHMRSLLRVQYKSQGRRLKRQYAIVLSCQEVCTARGVEVTPLLYLHEERLRLAFEKFASSLEAYLYLNPANASKHSLYTENLETDYAAFNHLWSGYTALAYANLSPFNWNCMLHAEYLTYLTQCNSLVSLVADTLHL